MMERQDLRKDLKENYDLIILDLMLPGVDGFEICRQIRRPEEYTDHHGISEER